MKRLLNFIPSDEFSFVKLQVQGKVRNSTKREQDEKQTTFNLIVIVWIDGAVCVCLRLHN